MPFSKSSLDNLATCDVILQVIAKRAIEVSKIDFGISCGYRSPEDQMKVFQAGKSKIDGVIKKSKHNYSPSKAFDVFGYVDGKADFSVPVMCYLAGVIQSVAADMNVNLTWGGNWDNDSTIITDQSFNDLPHFEI